MRVSVFFSSIFGVFGATYGKYFGRGGGGFCQGAWCPSLYSNRALTEWTESYNYWQFALHCNTWHTHTHTLSQIQKRTMEMKFVQIVSRTSKTGDTVGKGDKCCSTTQIRYCSSILTLLRSGHQNLHGIYQCRIYIKKLLMMAEKMPETYRVLWQIKFR
jgi:hypothetical protein